MPASFYQRRGKRLLDVTVALPLLAISSPALLATGLLVWLTIGSPVLFRQRRPGLRGRPFTLLKFRTMDERRNAQGRLLPDARRLTMVGNLLRRLSLDELPQLVNVLRGDMSLVGPRPLLMQYSHPLQRRAGPPPRCQAWDHGPRAGVWQKRPQLGRKVLGSIWPTSTSTAYGWI